MSMDNSFQPQPPQPAAKGKSPLKIVLIVLGIVGVLGVICCGSIVGFGYFGLGQVADSVKTKLNGAPAVTQEIGSIEEVSMNMVASGQEQQATGDDKVLVFDVVGSNGVGQVVAKPNGSGMELMSFRTSDGQEISVDSDAAISDDVDGPSFDLPL